MTLKPRLRKLSIYRHKDRVIIIFIISVLILLLPFLLARDRKTGAAGAELYFNNPTPQIPVGQTQTVELRLHTLGSPANAVGLVMHYNPNVLTLLNMTTAQSFCTFYTANSFDTIKGEVDLSCGAPNPGFSGDSVLLDLQFRGKNLGSTSLTFDRSQTQVLANDGKGTDLLVGKPPHLDLTVMQTL